MFLEKPWLSCCPALLSPLHMLFARTSLPIPLGTGSLQVWPRGQQQEMGGKLDAHSPSGADTVFPLSGFWALPHICNSSPIKPSQALGNRHYCSDGSLRFEPGQESGLQTTLHSSFAVPSDHGLSQAPKGPVRLGGWQGSGTFWLGYSDPQPGWQDRLCVAAPQSMPTRSFSSLLRTCCCFSDRASFTALCPLLSRHLEEMEGHSQS